MSTGADPGAEGASGSICSSVVTAEASTQVARRGPEEADEVETSHATDEDRRPWWVRVRAALGLTVLVVVLGVAAAGALGLTVLALATVLDRALG
jgi:hypothetical protein